MPQWEFFRCYRLLMCACLCHSSATWATLPEASLPPPSLSPNKSLYPWLDSIPQAIDEMPTLLPHQSEHRIISPKEDTKDLSWWDRTQDRFSNSLQKRAKSIDNWFGSPNPEKQAYATVKMMVDTSWNEYDDFSVKPRVRGRIKLPTLENRFSVVFGDDSLDNEIRGNVAITNENPISTRDKTLDSTQTKNDNASLALRWSDFRRPFGIDSDVDLGVRSTDDIFARIKLQKNWELGNDFTTYAEQIYRYGIDSKDYLRTNLEIRHARPDQAFISNQFSLTYTDHHRQELFWDNRLYRQHQFFSEHSFNYGLYLGGAVDNSTPELNSYGPFTSWRQPFLRQWFFVQAELNYLNDRSSDRDHFLGALLRLESHFK